MNKMMKIALGAMLAGLALPVFAQDNFPDVPDNHWAYEAVSGMKKAGCLVGYPDGMFRGGRPMSRYEFAAAAYACYNKMMGMYTDLSKQIAECMEACKNAPKGGDTSALQQQLKDMQSQVDSMKGWGARVGDLEKMMKEFEKELASMGVDMKKMRSDLSDLEGRVDKLEKIKPAVDIHGDLNFLVLAAHSTDKLQGMTPDNRILGVKKFGGNAGLTQDLTVLHEAAFKISGTNETGPKWEATIVEGNMVGPYAFGGETALGDMSTQNPGSSFGAGSSDMYINTANVTFDSSLVGQGFNAKIGRVGYQVGPYMWKRSDYTGYYHNERWDNGDYYFDGGILSFNFGKASVKVIGGTNSSVVTNNNIAVNPMFAFGGTIDRTLGVQLNFPVSEMGAVNLAYLWFDSDTTAADVNPLQAGAQSANRINVFGGDVDLKFDKFKIWGAYSQSTLTNNTTTALDTKNKAWDIRGSYDAGKWGAGLGYREVENFFSAPGSWGRIGNQWSPRNIKGFNAKLWIKPNEKTSFWAKGEFDEPKDQTVGFAYAGYDKMRSVSVGLDYALADNWGAMFSYEDVKFDGNAPTNDDKMRWYTLGFNYGLGANTSLMLTYQFSDNEFGAGSLLDPQGVPGVGGRRYKGGLFGTQLSVKF